MITNVSLPDKILLITSSCPSKNSRNPKYRRSASLASCTVPVPFPETVAESALSSSIDMPHLNENTATANRNSYRQPYIYVPPETQRKATRNPMQFSRIVGISSNRLAARHIVP